MYQQRKERRICWNEEIYDREKALKNDIKGEENFVHR